MNRPAIKAEGISKKYDLGHRHSDTLRDQIFETVRRLRTGELWSKQKKRSFWALQDISFEIGEGETVGIIGQNGAGKSTLLKILSRITEPTSGKAKIYGRVGSLLEVGTGFHPELTGRENIFLNGAIIGMQKSEISRLFNKIVEFSEIEEFIDTPVKRYSSGMYVRLAFAVSAHLRPDILMIDEVLSVGDLHFQRKCLSYAEDLQKSNSTILLVSHNMFSIKALCRRAIYLRNGKIRFDGPTVDAINLYEGENTVGILPGADNEIGRPLSKWPLYIAGIFLFDEHMLEKGVFDFGERMRIRLDVKVREPIECPNFIISFIRSDLVSCCNYNTIMDNYHISELSADMTLELKTPPLKLVSASYQIHILVRDPNFERLYCAQAGKTFHVRHNMLDVNFGVFHEHGEWVIPDEGLHSTIGVKE